MKVYSYVGAAVAAVGMGMNGLFAWQGSKFAIACLVTFSIVWIALAMFSGRSWRRTIDDWRSTIKDFKDAGDHAVSLSYLLAESLDALGTWDREKAEEIAER